MLAAWLFAAAVPLIAAAAGQGLPHAAAATRPQAAPQNPQEELPVFRAETNLALVRFHVVRNGSYGDDLNPKDIVVLEDGKPRQFSVFEGGRLARPAARRGGEPAAPCLEGPPRRTLSSELRARMDSL